MPEVPLGVLYDDPDLDMEIPVFQKGKRPGRSKLRTLRRYSSDAEANLGARLDSEAQARRDADTALGQRIDAEATTRAQADTAEANVRQAADTQEAQARASADTTLGQHITDEATARQNADTTEAQARAAADAQEKADRQAADSAEAKARADADTAEASTRAAADTALGNRLTTVEGKLPRTAILTYPGSDLTWTYPTPFAAGVVPVIEAVVETAASATALFNCQLVGPPTNTAVKIRINTIPAASVSLLGLVNLNLFQQAPSGVKLHVTARIPQ